MLPRSSRGEKRPRSYPLWALTILALNGFGCATFGTHPVADLEEASPPEAIDAIEETIHGPFGQVRQHLHEAFFDLQNERFEAASDSLDLAAETLILLLNPVSPSIDTTKVVELTPDERAGLPGLVQAAVELYDDVLPRAVGLRPDHPAVRLIESLPPLFESDLLDHPQYRNLYVRKLAGSSDVPIDLTDRVRDKIRFFQTNGAKVIRTWFQRSGVYDDLIRSTLREEGLPEDLIYLSMIESGFNPRAYSRARAIGLWQFIRHTGRFYGLKSTTWVEERRDPAKATHAAARHLKHLYDLFGDWRLVISAYNCGQGRLDRAIKQAGTDDFWQLDSLPRETKNHLPKFMAAALIGRDPEFFGIHDIAFDEPLAFDVVKVSEAVDLRVAAECAGTTYDRMRSLNPELKLGYSPPVSGQKQYALRVPLGTSDRFVTRYARIPESRKVQLVQYKVRPGQTVSHIARELGVSSRAILDANGIRDPRRLRAGQKLKIPVHPQGFNSATLLTSAEEASKSGSMVTYRVRKGDSLWGIAKQMGVKARQLQTWNELGASEHIHPGDRLTIYRAPRLGDAMATHYRVRRGDTLWDIARAFSTSVGELKRLNGIQNASSLRAGSQIRLRPVDTRVE